MDTFIEKRNKIKSILNECGVNQVYFSQNDIPEAFPCAHVKLGKRVGETPLSKGFENYLHRFEMWISSDDTIDPDQTMDNLISSIEDLFIKRFRKGFSEVSFDPAVVDSTQEILMATIFVEV